MRKLSLALSTLALASFGCTKFDPQQYFSSTNEAIFSNRPQNQTQFMTVVKLQNPSLLSALETKGGKKLINKNLAAAIDLEQNVVINKLKSISPDIVVIYKYRLVINGLAIVAPLSAMDQIQQISGTTLERPKGFSRPAEIPTALSISQLKINKASNPFQMAVGGVTSVSFIGSDKVHANGIRGQGIRVGVIDTGIDYTHAMMMGPGTEEAYKSIDPAQPSSLFPNKKVVGGIDLVGTKYDGGSDSFENRIPHPDSNPLDEAGHGSHVAGTIAGIGDGKETYDGVAPDAQLFAIKVFGNDGSTSDEVVIAGLEYAADPNGDLDLNDQLHVVNLSLGSQYGMSHIMYSEAIQNLSSAGTAVVASAGNEGPSDFITGAPGAVDDAFSVAASIDGMIHNLEFKASTITFPSGEKKNVENIEGNVSKPLADVATAEGELVYIGLADSDLSEEMKTQLKGKVALIDRGKVTFTEKLARAVSGGAIAAVVANNAPGEPIPMGGGNKEDKPATIPAIMVTQIIGQQIKDAMKTGVVSINLKTNEKIIKKELIDTITGFSSKGPRSLDARLKPEISAPGQNIISAAVGGGSAGIPMSGTSMAGPHIAGAMALMKQAHPELNNEELRSMVMGTSKTLRNKDLNNYPLSVQGAGRVQIDKAVVTPLSNLPSSLSLGIVSLDKVKSIRQSFSLKNSGKVDLNLTLKFEGSAALSMSPVQVTIPANESADISVNFTLNSASLKDQVNEVDGFVKVISPEGEIFKIAVLSLVEKTSNIKAQKLTILSTSSTDAEGSAVELKLANASSQPGVALLFNSLDIDGRKPATHGVNLSRICDLQAAGYRILGNKVQFAIKLYEPITTWHFCEISILLDTNGDQEPEQELAGNIASNLEGVTTKSFASLLLDAGKAREIRKEYEAELAKHPVDKPTLDYTPALQDVQEMTVFNNSTVAIVEVDRSLLATRKSGELAFKIATSSQDEYNVESDDFLKSETQWMKLDISDKAQAFMDLPARIEMTGHQEQSVQMTKGLGKGVLMLFAPNNSSSLGTLLNDSQMELVRAHFKAEK